MRNTVFKPFRPLTARGVIPLCGNIPLNTALGAMETYNQADLINDLARIYPELTSCSGQDDGVGFRFGDTCVLEHLHQIRLNNIFHPLSRKKATASVRAGRCVRGCTRRFPSVPYATCPLNLA